MRVAVKVPSPNRITLILCSIVLLLTLLSLSTVVLRFTWGSTFGGRLFYFNEEANLPTWFNSIILLYSSLLAWLIARSINLRREPFAKSWTLLGYALFAMSLDEFAQLHEAYGRFLRKIDLFSDLGLGFSVWLILGVSLVAIIALFIVRMWWHLPTRFKIIFSCSAIVYFSGSMVLETLGNNYAEQMGWDSLGFALFIHVEEVLEMIGIVILINGLMTYLGAFSNDICFEIKTSES